MQEQDGAVQDDLVTIPGVVAPPVRWTDPAGHRWEVTVMWAIKPTLRPVGVTVAAYDEADAVNGEFQLSGPSAPGEAALAEVTRGLFQRLPMGRMLDASRSRLLTGELRAVVFGEDEAEDEATVVTSELGAELLAAHRADRRRRSDERSGYGNRTEFLELVADAYKTACRQEPRRAAARTAELLSEADTYGAGGDDGRVRVRKWIAEARRAGLIPPTTQRRPGWSTPDVAADSDTTDDHREPPGGTTDRR